MPDKACFTSITFIEAFSDGKSRLFVKTVRNYLFNASKFVWMKNVGDMVSKFNVPFRSITFLAFVLRTFCTVWIRTVDAFEFI